MIPRESVPHNMASVRLDGLVKRFDSPEGTIVANDNIDLTVKDGEFIVIVGPSGSGKSTTLRCIAGLEDPSEGTLYIGEEDVTDLAPRERDLAMVFQNYALYPHKTVEGNMRYGLEKSGDLTRKEMDERVREFAEMMEIEETLEKRPDQLSGGQKQRVALGRAIIREPRLFLFDEPLANLDASLRKTMRTEIDELQSEVGITSVYVTHNQEEAMSIADDIAIMRDGQLQQVAPPSQIFNEPINLFVAQFVGSPQMNLYDAFVSEQDDAYRVNSEIAEFDVPKALVDGDGDVENVIVGLRPQDLYRASIHRTDGPAVDSEIRVVEPLGTEAILYGDAGGTEITAKVGQFHDVAAGNELSLTIAPEHIYLFEAETERLIKGRLDVERISGDAADEIEA